MASGDEEDVTALLDDDDIDDPDSVIAALDWDIQDIDKKIFDLEHRKEKLLQRRQKIKDQQELKITQKLHNQDWSAESKLFQCQNDDT